MLARIFREELGSVAPAAGLEELVAGYYLYSCGPGSGRVWAALDGHPALLFLLDPPYTIRFTGAHAAVFRQAFCCCYGLQNTYIAAWPRGMRLLVVKFTCNGLYQLLQRPLPAAAAGPLVPIDALWGPAGHQWAAEVCRAEGQSAQVALLDAFLLSRLPASRQAGYLVQAAVSHIRESRGLVGVQELCRQLGVNYKWLERNFKSRLGITPKHYINTIRFLHAYFSTGTRQTSLTAVALQHGYYDQNHFIKDFRKYTGRPPSRG